MTLARRRRDAPGPPTDSDDWKLAFLVPIAELTDRWSFGQARAVPYAVRNDVQLLSPAKVANYQTQLEARFKTYIRQRLSDTAVDQAQPCR